MSEAISGAGVGGVPDAASLIRATDSSGTASHRDCERSEAIHGPVGWVERSDTHQCRHVWRWVSLRSTHPTPPLCHH